MFFYCVGDAEQLNIGTIFGAITNVSMTLKSLAHILAHFIILNLDLTCCQVLFWPDMFVLYGGEIR